MNYETAVSALFWAMPKDAPPPVTTVDPSLARRLRDAMEPLSQHPVWSAQVNAALEEIGLDFLSGVVCGRAAALGVPSPASVVALFGSFEPAMLTGCLRSGWAACPPEKILTVRQSATEQSLAVVLADIDVAPVATVLRRVVETVDPHGRPMFAALRALQWPQSPVGQLWRACEALRERRGDAHIAAYTAAGLHPLDMHGLSELWLGMPFGSHSVIYGWSPEDLSRSLDRLTRSGLVDDGVLTTEGLAIRERIETRTDELEQVVLDALAHDADPIIDALNTCSELCIAAHSYPPDPYRRAGG